MDRPKDILETIARIFSTGDVSKVDSLFAAEYVDYQKPPQWDVEGPEEFRRIVAMARDIWPNLIVEVKDSLAEGNAVAGRLYWRSVDSFGKLIERETLEIIRLDNGKVIEHWGAKAWTKESPQS
jgi:predicted SnoaL-like aldol condensation-catalyzing enzyme